MLGCTHYPLLRAALAEVVAELWSHPVTLVDSAQAMADATAELLAQQGLLAPEPKAAAATTQLTCFVTDEARVGEVGARFLGQPLSGVQLVDL